MSSTIICSWRVISGIFNLPATSTLLPKRKESRECLPPSSTVFASR